jgi:hypothetical protein
MKIRPYLLPVEKLHFFSKVSIWFQIRDEIDAIYLIDFAENPITRKNLSSEI